MKKVQLLMMCFGLACFMKVGFVQAEEAEKPVLTVDVEHQCVEGVVIKFDVKALNASRKNTAVDLPILPFNAEDYQIQDPMMLTGIPVDSFGYPKRCTVFDDMKESSVRGDDMKEEKAK